MHVARQDRISRVASHEFDADDCGAAGVGTGLVRTPDELPLVVFGRSTLRNPGNPELAVALAGREREAGVVSGRGHQTGEGHSAQGMHGDPRALRVL